MKIKVNNKKVQSANKLGDKKKSANVNKLIINARKRRLVRRIVVVVFIFVIGAIVFATKSNFFIVKKVSILGNPVMSGEDVQKKTDNIIGQNIFFINKNTIINEVKKDPYVGSVEITRRYPNQVNINISEKQAQFYIQKDSMKYILDDDGILLEKTDNVDNRSLIEISGVDLKNIEVGSRISDDNRTLKLLEIFSQIIIKNPTSYAINYINLSDLTNIKVYIGKVEGRLGNDENIPDKMNKLLHIIGSPDVGIVKGYVDVGFNGAPVYYKEER